MDDLIFATVLAAIGAVLLWIFITFAYGPHMARKARANPRFVRDGGGEVREKGVGVRKCPVCQEVLGPGMLVKSKVFKTTSHDKVMQIFGCPYCWPENTEFGRICPVCEKVLPRGGYLIARYFEKPEHRHVHVLGCSGCRRG